jgi:hypothetical protein
MIRLCATGAAESHKTELLRGLRGRLARTEDPELRTRIADAIKRLAVGWRKKTSNPPPQSLKARSSSVRPENRLDATSAVRCRQWGMLPSMFDVGCDLLRLAGLALAARGFEPLGENLLRIGMEMVEGNAGDIEPARRPASPN